MTRSLKSLDAQAVARLQKEGALLVDVREPGEYAQAHIPGSQNIALSRLDVSELPLAPEQRVVFFCAGGTRTSNNASRLVAKAGRAEAYVMQGGISAWRSAGLPVESVQRDPAKDAQPGQSFFSRLLGR
ncbi:Rhodanese-related sulfurtransferase [Kaistia soli DSM 19436]|uniref:Rhodanese-related sulfurtransferase n=1 Tax=Kaistia soli DSM 19436 TaxID=1122133 RepID=A0A1M5E0R8_9HYPH|nr:rhodanese-like domain-containing protein [Kaistia soli]SHF72815.1 Rhodanese-related sulfurtransferase [Kaistia soli DSM 19436]